MVQDRFSKLKKKPAMSSRERILAALQGKPLDRIPFVPLIDIYTLLDMPPQVQKALQTAAGSSYWEGMLEASRAIGCDIMLRHVSVTAGRVADAYHLHGFGTFKPPVKTSSRMQGNLMIETLETPRGTLTATYGGTEHHGWIPHPVKHLVNNRAEMDIFHYAIDQLDPEPPPPAYENFLNAEAALGEDGIATASTSNTPIMDLIESLWGLENTYYLLQDYPSEVEEILEKLNRAQLRILERVAQSPARVVIQYENTSSTLLSPRIFRKYCLPQLNATADRLHAANKIFLIHMCGTLADFMPDFATAHFDGIADISPAPTGDISLDRAAEKLPGKVVVGGIDATTFVNPDLSAVETQVAALIENIKPYTHVLLGSADTAPRGTPLQTFRLVQHLAETLGSYDPHQVKNYHPGEFRTALQAQTDSASIGDSSTPPEDAGSADGMEAAMQELTRRLDGKRPDVTTVIRFDIADDRVYRLFIQAGNCRLEQTDGDAEVTLATKTKHLLAIFSGNLNPITAYMLRKIRIEGDLKKLGVLSDAAK